jgi:hypothetical protein
MEPFITSTQFNFIKRQAKILINAHATSNDRTVKDAVIDSSHDKVLNLFSELSDEQKRILYPLRLVRTDAEDLLTTLEPFVIPFKQITEQTIKKLFPKAKKLKMPSLVDVDFKTLTYLGWYDKGTNRKFIITKLNDKLIGMHGTVNSLNKKGICAICNGYEELDLFLSEQKGEVMGTYTKRGNYICTNSQTCNDNITTLDRFQEFIERINQK